MRDLRRACWKLALAAMPTIVFLPTQVQAATIEVTDFGTNLKLITIEGEINYRDDVEFRLKTFDIEKAIVAFNSPGGNLDAGLSIGKQIRGKSYATLVGRKLCASACALAWLGGVHRYMMPGASVGFHAAYTDNGTYVRESGLANALVGSYLAKLGLRDEAIIYITSAPPQYLNWLDVEAARNLGIDVLIIEKGAVVPISKGNVVVSANANSAASAFFKRVKLVGMIGASASTLECYKKAIKLGTLKSLEYCVVFDWSARTFDKTGAETMKWPRAEFFDDRQVEGRFLSSQAKFPWDGQNAIKLFQEWTAEAEKIASSVATNKN